MKESQEIEAIESEIRAAGLSLSEFHSAANVSASTWHRIRNETVIPNGATMRRIRAARAKLGKVARS